MGMSIEMCRIESRLQAEFALENRVENHPIDS